MQDEAEYLSSTEFSRSQRGAAKKRKMLARESLIECDWANMNISVSSIVSIAYSNSMYLLNTTTRMRRTDPIRSITGGATANQ